MEDLWPSGVALRWVASNHLVLRWLKTVVVSVEVVNMNAGSEVVMVGDVLVDCGAAWEMEVWPSRVVLRKKALNRREGHWLKTVVLNVVGKGAT